MARTNEKDWAISEAIRQCVKFLNPEQCRQIREILYEVLDDYEIIKTEKALSMNFSIPNDKYLDQFFAIKMVKGLSENTLRYYCICMNKFLTVVDKPIPEITTGDIRLYLAIRSRKDGITNRSLDNELRVLRTFFSTMQKEEFLAKDPTARIDKIKIEKKVLKPFTEMEMEQIRHACEINEITKYRDIAIIETLYSTGCRVSELCGMNVIDIKDNKIIVTGKGNKQRTVYLNSKALYAINEYLDTRIDEDDWDAPLFCGIRKKGGHYARLSKTSVETIVRKIGKEAGVEDCHPHRFRRTAATDAMRHGMPIQQVSHMLGHEDLSTTQIYAITTDDDVEQAHKKYLA